jgi:hypothetical protein
MASITAKPAAPTIPEFFRFEYDQLVDWLKNALEQFYVERAGAMAFAPFAAEVVINNGLPELGLKQVFNDETGRATSYKNHWRRAVMDLFRRFRD